MLIYPAPKYKTYSKPKILKNAGFSLMEILAVISLISIIFYVGSSMLRSSSRDELEQVVNSIQRGVRFANDESVIRNFTVRLKLIMDKMPQELALEYTQLVHFH